jgi:hypothetical protein
MPSLAHLDTKNTLNAALNAMFGGRGVVGFPAHGLQVNLMRLTDKAILEYEAARETLDDYLAPGANRPLSRLFRCFDHMETCVDALARAGRHAEKLRIAPGEPRVAKRQLPTSQGQDLIRRARNAIQHGEERILEGKTGHPTDRPVVLICTATHVEVGEKGNQLRYSWIASWLTSYHDLVRDLISRPGAR